MATPPHQSCLCAPDGGSPAADSRTPSRPPSAAARPANSHAPALPAISQASSPHRQHALARPPVAARSFAPPPAPACSLAGRRSFAPRELALPAATRSLAPPLAARSFAPPPAPACSLSGRRSPRQQPRAYPARHQPHELAPSAARAGPPVGSRALVRAAAYASVLACQPPLVCATRARPRRQPRAHPHHCVRPHARSLAATRSRHASSPTPPACSERRRKAWRKG
ncbi:uncharacterized protein [Miscanthus floridulus]|uniref:uncharacterized protein n=1 Tax=Miscanthus floridulus TaxID=154761 RepID=UPI00345A43FD